ncbi:hypothetical protein [Streptomyces sp. NPDC052225]|uniref:hypothetical protein n=1 Tax=Streptomyces sp. NPDC052225 TaxID=3154949 RepID=UPI003424DE35
MSRTLVFRWALGAVGVGVAAIGVSELWSGTRAGTPAEVAVWLVGAVVVHDGLLVPFVMAVGLLIGGGRARGALRAGLITAGCLILVAVPVVLRPGRPRNPSVLPLDYPLDLGLLLAGVACVTGGCAWWLRRRAARRARP